MQEKKRVIALGFFDGVHLGHGALLRRVTQIAKELGAVSAALTFDYHPKTFVGTKPVQLINTPDDRAALMRSVYGIEDVIVLPFDRAMMEMPWDRFVTEVLAEQFSAVHVVAGHDYHFGHKGQGTPQKLKELCAELGIGCDIIDRVELDGVTISSTHIRGLIEQGDLEEANRFLGHPHVLSGEVLPGRQIGRTIGIPTANLIIPQRVIVPAYGVYATRVTVEGREYGAVTNVGVRPTVDEDGGVTVESHLIDVNAQLYGSDCRVEFVRRLRGETKFESLAALQEQIAKDVLMAKGILER